MPAMKGVIPREEGALGISDGSVRDIALISRVNHPVCFTVEDIITKDGAPLAVLSRKKAQAACMREFIDFFTPGDVIDAAVTHLEPFGAFCDIGCGIVALLPVDCISVSRIFHPKDRFFVGQSKGFLVCNSPSFTPLTAWSVPFSSMTSRMSINCWLLSGRSSII